MIEIHRGLVDYLHTALPVAVAASDTAIDVAVERLLRACARDAHCDGRTMEAPAWDALLYAWHVAIAADDPRRSRGEPDAVADIYDELLQVQATLGWRSSAAASGTSSAVVHSAYIRALDEYIDPHGALDALLAVTLDTSEAAGRALAYELHGAIDRTLMQS